MDRLQKLKRIKAIRAELKEIKGINYYDFEDQFTGSIRLTIESPTGKVAKICVGNNEDIDSSYSSARLFSIELMDCFIAALDVPAIRHDFQKAIQRIALDHSHVLGGTRAVARTENKDTKGYKKQLAKHENDPRFADEFKRQTEILELEQEELKLSLEERIARKIGYKKYDHMNDTRLDDRIRDAEAALKPK